MVHLEIQVREEKLGWTETKIRDFLDSVLRLGKEFSDRIQIEYVHRVRGADSNCRIIVKFLRDKDVIFKKAKETLKHGDKFGVNEDFTQKVKTSRKHLSPFLVEAREKGYKVSMRYDKLMIDSKLYNYNENTRELQEMSRK